MIAAVDAKLSAQPRRWLVTGSAGFIGSHLVERLLKLGQHVTSLDSFATGKRENLDAIRAAVGDAAWQRHRFVEGDIADLASCHDACSGVELVLHQAALGSVPRSIEDPINSNRANVTGFLNMLVASKDAGVKRFVYAASSSTYGDEPTLPKVEDRIGRPLSPYAVTKLVNELYADVFARAYGFESIGLRYFNVFGTRQDPEGAYAAVIPRWVRSLLLGQTVMVNGDGETSRDFCYVANAVQANLLAATTTDPAAVNQVYNVAANAQTSLTLLYKMLQGLLIEHDPQVAHRSAQHGPFRAGDVRHSLADISKAERLLGYRPTHSVASGLQEAVPWYVGRFAPAR